jgi:hypothetical protein
MPQVGFEPTIAAGERPLTYALDGAATGTGNDRVISNNKMVNTRKSLIRGVIPAFDLSVVLRHCANPFSDYCPTP